MGRRWNFRRTVTEFGTVDEGIAARPTNMGPTDADIESLSDYELAERLRPIVLHEGKYEYVLAEPDVERTREARALNSAGASLQMQSFGGELTLDENGVDARLLRRDLRDLSAISASINNGIPQSRRFSVSSAPTHLVPFAESEQFAGASRWKPMQVIPGDDNRAYVDPANLWTTAAYTSAVSMRNTVTNGKCSSRLIGATTGVSAAHCFYVRGSPGTWTAGFNDFRAGLIVRGLTGGVTFAETKAYGPWSCYSVMISGGYVDPNVGSVYDDWAILDYNPAHCGNVRPGDVAGSLPVGIPNSNSDYGYVPTGIDGFDGEAPLPYQSPSATYTYYTPSLITRSRAAGGMWVDSTYSWFLVYTHDTTGGASGSGLRSQLFSGVGDPTWYTVGMHRGAYGSYNGGRRIDWYIYNQIVAFVVDW